MGKRTVARITPANRKLYLHSFEKYFDTPITGFNICCSQHLTSFQNLWAKQKNKKLQCVLEKAEKAYITFQKTRTDYDSFYKLEFNQVLSKRMDALVDKIKTLHEKHQNNIEALKAEIATCTFSEEQCASELKDYMKLLQQDRDMIPIYESRDEVRSAYRGNKLSHHEAKIVLCNILIRKAIENAEWYCPTEMFQIAERDAFYL
jgi:hypothetical protein